MRGIALVLLAAPLAAQFAPYGNGCGGYVCVRGGATVPVPALVVDVGSPPPQLGATVRLALNAPLSPCLGSGAGLLLMGTAQADLPLLISQTRTVVCKLLTSGETTLSGFWNGARWTFGIPIPNSPCLLGATFFTQGVSEFEDNVPLIVDRYLFSNGLAITVQL